MSKILFFSNVHGQFEKVNELVNKIEQKSGKFDIIFLIGNTFNLSKEFKPLSLLENMSNQFIINDVSEVGTVLKHQHREGLKLKTNIFLLGRSGIHEHNNFNIAYISGVENKKYLIDQKYHYTSKYFDKEDIQHLLNQSKSFNKKIDFLIINSIPSKVFEDIMRTKANLKRESLIENVAYSIEIIISELNPRYIISSTEEAFYFERIPYINNLNFLSRYIHISSLPQTNNNSTEKYIYALNVSPVNLMSNSDLFDLNTEYDRNIYENQEKNIEIILKTKSTNNVLTNKNLKVSLDEIYVGNLNKDTNYEELYEFLSSFGELADLNMIYDDHRKKKVFKGYAFAKFNDNNLHKKLISMSNTFSFKGRKVIFGEKIEQENKKEDIESICWFCFNNPNIDKDLIIKSFKYFYLAFAKGPINSYHFLVIPKSHIQCYMALPIEHKQEFYSIIKIIINFLYENEMDYIMNEKNLPYNNEIAKHMNVHIVGIEKKYTFSSFDVINDFLRELKLKYVIFDSNKSIEEFTKTENDYYYYMDFPVGINNIRSKVIIYVKNQRHDFIDIPRNLICYLLDIESKSNWKKCQNNKEEEEKIKAKFNIYIKLEK